MTPFAVPRSQNATVRPRRLFVGLVLINLFLLGIGVAFYPLALSVGLFPTVLMQVVYGLSAWFGLKDTSDQVEIRFSLWFGILIALVFAGEIILELLITIDNNTPLANAEYGTVFLLLFLTGLIAAWQSGRIQTGLKAALWAAIFGLLVWYAMVLLTYYLFHDTPHQQHAFAAEGTFDDFRASGMTDFNAFALQDFWGAGFFHLFFAPFFALILGGAGGFIGIATNRFRRHNKTTAL